VSIYFLIRTVDYKIKKALKNEVCCRWKGELSLPCMDGGRLACEGLSVCESPCDHQAGVKGTEFILHPMELVLS